MPKQSRPIHVFPSTTLPVPAKPRRNRCGGCPHSPARGASCPTYPESPHRILSALNRLAEAENPVVGSPSELAERCGRYDVECSEYEVSQVLREYGFEAKSIRREGESRKRYTLSHDELTGITARYLGGNEECESLAASIGLATA